MRYFEIILKIAFVVMAITLIFTNAIASSWFSPFLVVSGLLGIVLIFNKDESYGMARAKSDYTMRKTEGVLLILFAIVVAVLIH